MDRRKTTRLLFIPIVLVVAICATSASAQVGSGSWAGYNHIPQHTKQFTFDQLLLVDYDVVDGPEGSDTTTTTREILWNGSISFDYFVVQNLAVGANVGYFWDGQKTIVTAGDEEAVGEQVDSGLLTFVIADYYLRLGNSMFLRPGVGVGFFYGKRRSPVVGEENLSFENDLYGFAGKLELGGVFYTSSSFSLRAGVSLLARVLTESPVPEEGEEETTDATEDEPSLDLSGIALDAAFSIGFGYAF